MPSSAPPRRIRLQDYIPESLVFDYKSRDIHSLKLSGFQHQVTVEEVRLCCQDAARICHRFGHECRLLGSIAEFESEQKAVETAKVLKEATLRGCPFHVLHCGARWNCPKHSPKVLEDTLNLHGVPEEFCVKDKLATFFPTGCVVDVLLDGIVQVKFPSAIDLIKAVKDPRCWTIGGENIQFALAVAKKKDKARRKPNLRKHNENKENISENPGCSRSNNSG
ncbi:hypothetical protein V5799_029510 [Amblyomma americanum]|uniref:Uncharacterized protein n=1 Tax=Amblyomma americanum TaxID=6943 RepID=A0AAQ4ER52_AMBAM